MKRAVLLGITMCFAIGLSAQSIVGKWRAERVEDNGAKMTVIMVFTPQKALSMDMTISMNDPEAFDMSIQINMNGKYDDGDGKNIPYSLDSKNADLKISKLEFHGELAELLKEDENLKDSFKEIVEKQALESKEEIVDEIPSEGTFVIKEITANTMKLMIDDDDDDVLDMIRIEPYSTR